MDVRTLRYCEGCGHSGGDDGRVSNRDNHFEAPGFAVSEAVRGAFSHSPASGTAENH
jgi:hypothetical protein